MGLLEMLFPKKELNENKQAIDGYFKTLTAYQPRFTTWGGELYESELVRSAIDARARNISKLKVEFIGSAQPQLKRMIMRAPNGFQTWSQFLYRLSTILDMNGTAFILPVFNSFMEMTGYYTAYVKEWELVKDDTGAPWLRITYDNREERSVYRLNEVGILTRFQYKDDFFGTSNTALYDTMSLIDLQNQGIEEAITNGATYRFMAQTNNFLKSDDLVKERQRFSLKNFSSDADGGGLLLFPNTYTNIQQIHAQPYEVDATQKELIQRNVYNYFGVNEAILQNKCYGDEWNAFYEGAIEPFSVQFSEVISKMTFTIKEQRLGSQIMATANRLQYMSNKDKLDFTNNGLDRGMISINEAREVYNMAPVDGGDVRTIRGEYKNADELEEGNANVNS